MYNAVFISDVHLGTTKNSDKIVAFLKNLKTKKLFLVGDMVSFSVNSPLKELDEFFYLVKNGSWELIYIIGNHEKENLNIKTSLARYFEDIKFYDNFIYEYKDKKIFIEHGDSFHYKDPINRAIKNFMLKSKVKIYKKKRSSFISIRNIYYLVKPAIKIALYNSYLKYIVNQAKARECNYAICGHLHQPKIKKLSNITYINCGDWTRNCTFVALKDSGELKLLYI